jgi:hypothetical protein
MACSTSTEATVGDSRAAINRVMKPTQSRTRSLNCVPSQVYVTARREEFTYIALFTEFQDLEDEGSKIAGLLEDICHMKDNEIVLRVSSFHFDKFLGDWCRTFFFSDRRDRYLVILDIWYYNLSSNLCN